MNKQHIYIIIFILLLFSVNAIILNKTEFDDGSSSFNITLNTTKYITLPINSSITQTNLTLFGIIKNNNEIINPNSNFEFGNSTNWDMNLDLENSQRIFSSLCPNPASPAISYPAFLLSTDTPISSSNYSASICNPNQAGKDSILKYNFTKPNVNLTYYIKYSIEEAVSGTQPHAWIKIINRTNGNNLLTLENISYSTSLAWTKRSFSLINITESLLIFQVECDSGNGKCGYIAVDEILETEYPQNLLIIINSTIIFNNTGNLTGTNTSINLNPTGQLESCFNNNNTCPISFSADDWGQLEISNLDISYNYNLSVLSSTFDLSTAYANDTIYGMCNATNQNSNNMDYTFLLYNGSIELKNGTINNISDKSQQTVVNQSVFKKGENYTLSCKAYDTVTGLNSTWLNSTTLTISNSRPYMNTPLITSFSYANTSIIGNSTYYDIDSDNGNITFLWKKNGTLILSDLSNINKTNNTFVTSTLGVGNYTHFDNISLDVIGWDGDINSTLISSSTLQINNSPPITSNILIVNVTAGLNCSYTYSDYDSDSRTNQFFNWFNNNVSLNITEEILGTGNYTTNDQLICSIQVYDGYINSSVTNSSSYLVGDVTLPIISSYSLDTSSGYPDETHTLSTNCLDDNSIASGYPKVQFLDPASNMVGNYSMSLSSGTLYTKSYIFSSIGSYSNFTFFCKDGNGNEQTNTTSLSFASSTRPTPVVGGGGGEIGNKPQTFKIVISNLNAEETKQLSISPSDKREYCLDLQSVNTNKVQEIRLVCLVPSGSPRNDMCSWITLPTEKISLIPTEQNREKFCMDITTPANIVIGDKYVVEIVGTSSIDSQIQKHKITMWVTDYSLFVNNYFKVLTEDSLTQQTNDFIRDNVSSEFKLIGINIPNYIFPMIIVNQILFWIVMGYLTKNIRTKMISNTIFYFTVGITTMFLFGGLWIVTGLEIFSIIYFQMTKR